MNDVMFSIHTFIMYNCKVMYIYIVITLSRKCIFIKFYKLLFYKISYNYDDDGGLLYTNIIASAILECVLSILYYVTYI